MGKVWQRFVFGVVVIALVVLTAASWEMIVTGSGGESEGVEKMSAIRGTKTDRDAGGKVVRTPVDTDEWRREALEILGRLDEYPEVLDIIDDAARLSEIFRQWGRVDFEEARRFLEREEVARKLQRPDRSFADDLLLAALIGYSQTDPVSAWDVFLDTRGEIEILNSWPFLHPDEVTAEQIMRALFAKSEEVALKLLRELEAENSHLFAPCLRAIMSETDDAVFREELFKEFYESDKFRNGGRAGLVCAGLAEHDPQMAWEFLCRAAKGIIIDFDPELHLGMEFIGSWSRRQPEEALRFVAEFKRERLQDESQALLLMSFIYAQHFYRPELIVEALEMESLRWFQDELDTNGFSQSMGYKIPWPLIDEDVPLSRETQSERFRVAVEASEFPDSLKEGLLKAFELKQGK